MAAIFSALIPVALKLLEMWLKNNEAKEAAYGEFIAFLDKLSPEVPIGLRDSYKAQRERVRRELEGVSK